MTILHIDLLYLSARTYFRTDILMKNKQGILIGTLKPVDSKQRGFYYVEASLNKQKYAVTIPIEGSEEKSVLISQIHPDTGKVFVLCEVNIHYNLIRFERGFFMSDYVENNGYGVVILAHKSNTGKTPQFVNWRSALSRFLKENTKRRPISFTNPHTVFDEWHLTLYRNMMHLAKESFDITRAHQEDNRQLHDSHLSCHTRIHGFCGQ